MTSIRIMANLYSSKYYRGKKLKTCQERQHLLNDRFIKVFYKMTIFVLSRPKSGCLIQAYMTVATCLFAHH